MKKMWARREEKEKEKTVGFISQKKMTGEGVKGARCLSRRGGDAHSGGEGKAEI